MGFFWKQFLPEKTGLVLFLQGEIVSRKIPSFGIISKLFSEMMTFLTKQDGILGGRSHFLLRLCVFEILSANRAQEGSAGLGHLLQVKGCVSCVQSVFWGARSRRFPNFGERPRKQQCFGEATSSIIRRRLVEGRTSWRPQTSMPIPGIPLPAICGQLASGSEPF